MRNLLTFILLWTTCLQAGPAAQRRVRHMQARELGNCAACFDAPRMTGFVDGDAVATWADTSGNGRDATQAVALLKPTYKAAIKGGLPIVRFDGGDVLLTSSFAHFPSKRGTLMVMFTKTGGGSYAEAISTYPNSPYMIFYTATAGTAYKWGSGTDFAAAANDTLNLFQFQVINKTANTSCDFWRNVSLVETFSPSDNQTANSALSIGASTSGIELLTGDIGYAAEFSVSLTTPQVFTFACRQKFRWRL